MQVNIKNPCPADWGKMKIGVNSRFCDSCQKNVIDFTNKSRKEILEYLLTNYNQKTCGRFYRSQLDFSNTDFLVTINALAKQHKNTNLSFYLLTVGTLMLAGCDNNQTNKNNSSVFDTVQLAQSTKDTIENVTPIKDTIQTKKGCDTLIPDIIPFPDVLGEVAIDYKETIEPYIYADTMPMFAGGVDSLINYLKQNVQYPEWENKNRIEGTVIVNFVVDKSGKIKDAKILKTVKGSKNFDAEVLRVVNNMPDWIAGQKDGKNVDVQFNLPVQFKL